MTYLASAGDSGYSGGLVDPATFQDVVAVGGTALAQGGKGKRGWTETIWYGAGGGCSATQEAKPTWQTDPDCKYRTGDDLSAQASIEVAEYDTYGYDGWLQIGGTSVASPLLGGMYALAGNASKQTGGENLWNTFSKMSFEQQEKNKNIYLHLFRKQWFVHVRVPLLGGQQDVWHLLRPRRLGNPARRQGALRANRRPRIQEAAHERRLFSFSISHSSGRSG